jgi:hypothetical protein
VLGHRNFHRSGRDVPPDNFTARRSGQATIVVVERGSLDKVVHVESRETITDDSRSASTLGMVPLTFLNFLLNQFVDQC